MWWGTKRAKRFANVSVGKCHNVFMSFCFPFCPQKYATAGAGCVCVCVFVGG